MSVSAHTSEVTPEEALKELNREIGLRYGFYKKQIARKKMSEKAAHEQIGKMTAAASIISDVIKRVPWNVIVAARKVETKL